MTDFRLLMVKYGRVALPLIALMAICSVMRNCSSLAVQQIGGVGTMLLFVTLTVFSADALLRLIGLCDDRLLLLSPQSRWALAAEAALVLIAYNVLAYIVSLLALIRNTSTSASIVATNICGYIVGVFAQLGLMLAVIFALKFVRHRAAYTVSAWLTWAAVIALMLAGGIQLLRVAAHNPQWIIGVGSNDFVTHLYTVIMPITVAAGDVTLGCVWLFIGLNLLFAVVVWGLSALFAKRRMRFLKLV